MFRQIEQHALLIGCQKYEGGSWTDMKDLNSVSKDIEMMTEFAKRYSFNITIMMEPTYQ